MRKVILTLLVPWCQSVCSQNSKEPFDVYNVKDEKTGTTVIYAKNDNPCDESVIVRITALKNMKADVELPYEGVVPAGSKEYKLFTLKVRDPLKETQMGYRVEYCHGDIFNGEHDNDYPYLIPYQNGEKYPLNQGYGGKFSHYFEGRTHALDFLMPVGTPVCAAREGIVLDAWVGSDQGGKNIKYMDDANYIIIYHKDGSMAEYSHLMKDGSKVEIGDTIKAGQVIALSGNTGWSTGPHLHFQVYSYDENMEERSIPTKFLQEEGKLIRLQQSKKGYTSMHE